MRDWNDEDIYETTHYDGALLEEYNGKWSLLAMDKGSNETWYKRWMFQREWRKGEWIPGKNWPAKVVLGDKDTAIQALKWLLRKLENHP